MTGRVLRGGALLTLLVVPAVALAALPSASTGGARAVTETAATLNGTLNPNSEPTSWYFEYGATKSYGSRSAQQGPTAATKGNQHVSAVVDGLTPATTYHYRFVATNGSGTKTGGDRTFKTQKPAPTISMTASSVRTVFGRSTVLGGQFTPSPGGRASGVKVTLQQDAAPFSPADFSAAATTQTDAAGHFSFTQTPASNTTYRVVAATNPKATSAPIVVNVALKVTVSLSSSHPKRGRAVAFSGTVTPQHNGQLVRIQKRVGARWRTVKTGVLVQAPGAFVSTYRVRVRVRTRGTYRAYVAGDAQNVTGTSRNRVIKPR
jgi:hypothetical protein